MHGMPEKPMKRSWLWVGAKFFMAALLLGIALYFLDWSAISTSLERIHPAIFTFAVLLHLPGNVLLALRWHYIVRSDVPLPVLEHIRRYFISAFINLYTPSNIGGDIYRFLNLRKVAKNNWHMAGLILRERLIGIAGYALFYLVCFAGYLLTTKSSELALPNIYWFGVVCFSVGLAGFYFAPAIFKQKSSFLRRITRTKFGEMLSVGIGMGRFGEIILMQTLSLCTCSLWTLSFLLIAWDLEMDVGFAILGMVGILTDLVRLIPISIQGIGVREGTFAMLLWTMGFSMEQGFVLGLASYLAVTAAVAAVGGVAFIMSFCMKKTPAGTA